MSSVRAVRVSERVAVRAESAAIWDWVCVVRALRLGGGGLLLDGWEGGLEGVRVGREELR